MGLENSRRTGSNPEYLDPQSTKTIAVMKLGEKYYYLKEDSTGKVSFVFTDPNANRLDYLHQTQDLRTNHFHEFAKVDGDQVRLVELNFSSLNIQWHDRTKINDEPTVILQAQNAIKNTPIALELHEQELLDLFLKSKGDSEKSASFFTADTLSHEVIGIALRRQYPVLAFIKPGNVDGSLSPKFGMLTLLENLYKEYIKHLSPLQWKTDQAIFEQFGPNGSLRLPEITGGNVSQIQQIAILKKIYMLKSILQAGVSENSVKADQDPELLSLVPFLHSQKPSTAKRTTGLFQVFSRQTETTATPHQVQLGTLESLIDKPHDGLLIDTRQTYLYQPWDAQPITPAVIPQTPTPHPETKPDATQPQSTDKPVEKAVRTITEKQEAILASREIVQNMLIMMKEFSDVRPDEFGEAQVNLLHREIGTTFQMTKEYMQKFQRGKAPASPVTARIESHRNTINIAGIVDEKAFNFFNDGAPKTWQESITASGEIWTKYVKPLFALSRDPFDRTTRALSRYGTVRRNKPELADAFLAEFKKALAPIAPHVVVENIDNGLLAHAILMIHIMYALCEQYAAVKQSGEAVEIHNWVSYVSSTLNTMQQLDLPK